MDVVGTGLVIGYGSIGRRHARVLRELTPSLAIVNRRETIRAQAQRDHPSAWVVDRLQALDELDFPWPATLAVIATWGPSHSDFFHQLADRGVRHILCEKPMAVSVAQATAMVRRAKGEGISLGVNHCLRYVDIVPSLRQFLWSHALGEPVRVVVSGGAACMATNGLHWLDFAAELFGVDPQEVVGFVRGDRINPRSPDLMYFGGGAVWRFVGGREAVLLLSNLSSVEQIARIYCADSVVVLSYAATVEDTFIQASIWRAAPRRYEDAAIEVVHGTDELLFTGRLPGVRMFLQGIRAAMEDVVHAGAGRSPGAVGLTAVSAVVGALASERDRRAMKLPILASSPWGRHEWPMS